MVFSSVGYEKFMVEVKKIPDTIFLKPKVVRLSEMIIEKKKDKRSLKIGRTEGERALIWDFSIFQNQRINIITKYFPQDKVYDEMSFLKTVKVRTYCDVKDTFFNLRLYSKGDNGEPDGLLYEQDIIGEVKRGDRILAFDVSKLNVILPSDGFFVAIERIMPEEEKRLLKDGSVVSCKGGRGPGLITVKDANAYDTWSIFRGVWKKWRGITAAIELEVTN